MMRQDSLIANVAKTSIPFKNSSIANSAYPCISFTGFTASTCFQDFRIIPCSPCLDTGFFLFSIFRRSSIQHTSSCVVCLCLFRMCSIVFSTIRLELRGSVSFHHFCSMLLHPLRIASFIIGLPFRIACSCTMKISTVISAASLSTIVRSLSCIFSCFNLRSLLVFLVPLFIPFRMRLTICLDLSGTFFKVIHVVGMCALFSVLLFVGFLTGVTSFTVSIGRDFTLTTNAYLRGFACTALTLIFVMALFAKWHYSIAHLNIWGKIVEGFIFVALIANREQRQLSSMIYFLHNNAPLIRCIVAE